MFTALLPTITSVLFIFLTALINRSRFLFQFTSPIYKTNSSGNLYRNLTLDINCSGFLTILKLLANLVTNTLSAEILRKRTISFFEVSDMVITAFIFLKAIF